MDRRAFLGIVSGAATSGGAGLRPLLADSGSDNVVIAELDPETEILACSAMSSGGFALLHGLRSRRPPLEFVSAELVHFSALGQRLTSVPIPALYRPSLHTVAGSVALDHNGALWMLRKEAHQIAKYSGLARLAPGEPPRVIPVSLPEFAQISVMYCEADAVWCALKSNSGYSVVRFDTSSHGSLSHTLPGLFIYRLFRADAGHMLAASGRLGADRRHELTTTIYVLNDSLKPVASATLEGWIQDAACTAPTGSAPAMLHLATVGNTSHPSLRAVETFAFPELRQLWVRTWADPEEVVPGSVLFVNSGRAPVLVRISPKTREVLAGEIEPRASERVLPILHAPRKLFRAYPVRRSGGARYLLAWYVLVNGHMQMRIALSPELTTGAKG